MPQRSAIEQLPPEARADIEALLIRGGFADYLGLTERVNELLAGQGLELRISKSALHRFGRGIEERIETLKKTRELARTIVKEAGDDEGAMNDALLGLMQDKLFESVMALKVDPEEVNIYKLGKVIADLGRASVQQKKHQLDARDRDRERLEQLTAETTQGKRKLDPETLRVVREELYGFG